MQFPEATRTHRRISLTPLIDVVFLLLVFFMLSSSFIRWRQVDLHAGTSVASQIHTHETKTHWISVHIQSCAADDVVVDGVAMPLAGVSLALKDIAKPHSKVRLTSVNTVSLACVIKVLDEIEASNITATTVEGLIK